MLWKFVFNSNLIVHYWNIDKLFEIVRKTGYDFFTHNDDIYVVSENRLCYWKTKLTIKDLI